MAPETTGAPTPPPRVPQPASNRFFAWMRGLGIYRQPGWIGGVCAGIAARIGIDVIIVRGLVVVLALFGAPILLFYAAAWLLLPDDEDRIHLERLTHGEFTAPVIGVGVLFLLSLLPFGGLWSLGAVGWAGRWGGVHAWSGPVHALWILLVIAAIVWFIVWAARRARDGGVRGRGPGRPAGFDYGPPDAATRLHSAAEAAAGSTAGAAASEPASGNADEPGTGKAAAGPAGGRPEAPTPPPAPETGDVAAMAAWKDQQANWKREYDAWRHRESESERLLARDRAAQERRLRQEQSRSRQREWAERNRRTRSNPVYSLIAIGVALVAGAAAALLMAGLSPAGWSITTAIAGLCVLLAVLGLAVIVNGFLGRRSGGAGGLAVLVIIALALTMLGGWAAGSLAGGRFLEWSSPGFSASAASQPAPVPAAIQENGANR